MKSELHKRHGELYEIWKSKFDSYKRGEISWDEVVQAYNDMTAVYCQLPNKDERLAETSVSVAVQAALPVDLRDPNFDYDSKIDYCKKILEQ